MNAVPNANPASRTIMDLGASCIVLIALSFFGSIIGQGIYVRSVYPHTTFWYTVTAVTIGSVILAVMTWIIKIHCVIVRGFTFNNTHPIGILLFQIPFVAASYVIGVGIFDDGSEEGRSANKWDAILFVILGQVLAEVILCCLVIIIWRVMRPTLPPQPNPGVALAPLGGTGGLPGGAPVLHARA